MRGEHNNKTKEEVYYSRLMTNRGFIYDVMMIRQAKSKVDKDKLIVDFADKYALDYRDFVFPNSQKDCFILPKYRRPIIKISVNSHKTPPTFKNNIEKSFFEAITFNKSANSLSVENYPISIDINPLASEKEVIDYIRKNWKKNIEPHLADRKAMSQIVKVRKDEVVQGYIWENKHKGRKEIATDVNKIFNKKYTYSDINTIIKNERNRNKKHIDLRIGRNKKSN